MMPQSSRRFGIVLALIVVVVSALAPAYVASAAQTSPPPSTGVGNLFVVSGEPMEFDFLYGGANQPAQINLGNPAGSVRFDVYTDWQWRDLAAGDRSIVPIGRGTPNPREPGQLFWEGKSPEAGFYHVQVTSNTAQPASFWIALSGAGAASALVPVSSAPPKPAQAVTVVPVAPVSTALPSPQPTLTPAPTATRVITTTAPTAAPTPVVTATAPATQAARTGAGNWQALGYNPMEYVFRYGGGDAPASVLVGADPTSAVAFNVYTDKQWTDLGNGMYWTIPVGRGTHNANAPGDLYWEARTSAPELYHVQLYRLGRDPARFWIDLGGYGAVGGLEAKSPPAK